MKKNILQKYSLFLLLFCFTFQFAHAQCNPKIDSLLTIYSKHVKENAVRKETQVLNELAREYILIGQKEEALDYGSQALSLAEKIKDTRQIVFALRNIGLVQYKLDPQKFENTVSLFKKAINLSEKSAEKLDYAHVCADYARFYYEIKYIKEAYLDSASKYYNITYAIYKGLNQKNKLSATAEALAEVYFEKGDQDKALEYSDKSLEALDVASFSKASIIKRSLDAKISADAGFRYVSIFALILMVVFIAVLIRSFLIAKTHSQELQGQKDELSKTNKEIEIQKNELEEKNIRIKRSFQELEDKTKKIEAQNREIEIQKEELQIKGNELLEKNEELLQQQEEIKTQRDNLGIKTEELEKSYETITILSKIGQSITSSLKLEEVFVSLYHYIKELMHADGIAVAEYEIEDNHLAYKFVLEGENKKNYAPLSLKNQKHPATWCIKNAIPITIQSQQDLIARYEFTEDNWNSDFQSGIYMPLLSATKVIGIIAIFSKDKYAYTPQHLEMIKTLSAYTTIALKNAETYEILNAAQQQLIESEKMAALGNLVAGVAHEINTPVGICVTAASRLDSKTKELNNLMESGQMKKKDLSDFIATSQEGMKILLTNLQRAADLVQGFKRVAVEQSIETKRTFELKKYLEETIMSLRPELKNKPYQIELDLEDIQINSFAGGFSQILTNLIMNSIIHGFKGRENGIIKIETKQKNKSVIFVYSDNGNGMTPEVQAKIYEPFFTTNRENGGSGLGMNIVYNLAVQKLGGKLTLESEENKGVRFTFEIPLGV
ncbi:MAG: hypothetical protein EAZ85_11685 [Bacteroidetes bacterium]|nr:MAG: hypothetical protein EAZ85_11685 [Bacteroidota bacterium]TAG87442.1 MAG: hypothetical protein EAZ20_10640 [Bacteroidota bacterium]